MSGFATFRTRSGEVRRRGICKQCRNNRAQDNFEELQKWRKEYNSKNRSSRLQKMNDRKQIARSFVNEYKLLHPCADCGGVFPPVAMDFDHVNGPKIRNISSLVNSGYNLTLIKEEIEKCEVVCACCHRVRTEQRKENVTPSNRGDMKINNKAKSKPIPADKLIQPHKQRHDKS